MRVVLHTIADIMRPNFEPTELGVIINANQKIVWARKT